MTATQTYEAAAKERPLDRRKLVKAWALFIAIGAALYLALYAWSEGLVYQHGEKNRFFMIRTAPLEHYDTVILGASHAMPFGFEDMNAGLEDLTGTNILNLSIEGSGILPNWLVLDYFLAGHSAKNVVLFLDSFGFYSGQWNEDRLDTAALQRAPLDLDLIATLWRYPWARGLIPAYVSGFPKINNHDRFEPDIPEAEGKFESVYRPFPQIDRQRIRFLYPDGADPAAFQRYLERFSELIRFIEERGMEVIVVKPPTPPRYRENLPAENEFDAAVGAVMAEHDVAYYDFSTSLEDDQYFYDTDHLNRDGVVAFSKADLAPMLTRHK